MTLTTAPVAGPNAKPAMRQTMADGSYLSQGTAGRIGNYTNSVQIAASAQNSAVTAMRLVLQPEPCSVVE